MRDGGEEGGDQGKNCGDETSESGGSEASGRQAVGEREVGDGRLELSGSGSLSVPLLLLCRRKSGDL